VCVFEGVRVGVCLRESNSVCVQERERERVCVCLRESHSVCVCKREREKECVCRAYIIWILSSLGLRFRQCMLPHNSQML
jgi:hypothetical protein